MRIIKQGYNFVNRFYYKDYVALTFLDTFHVYGEKVVLQ